MSSPARATVDPRGYLSVEGSSWGVDWWVGAEDRWHVPATEASVRQVLVGATPVVQTSIRVPGGDVHQRLVAFAGAGGAYLAVEIVNDSAAPVALAMAVLPATPSGVGEIRTVGLTGRSVTVDGAGVLVLPQRPARALLFDAGDGDPLAAVVSGAAPVATDGQRTCPDGLAGAVVVVPVAHRATWRAVVTLGPAGARSPSPPATATARLPGAALPPALLPGGTGPSVEAAVRGWRAQVDRQVRLDLPVGKATSVLDAARGHLLLAATAGPAVIGPAASGPAAAGPGAVGPALDGCTPGSAEVAVAAATAGLAHADPGALLAAAAAGTPIGAAEALWAAQRLVALGDAAPEVGAVAEAAEMVAEFGVERGAAGESSVRVVAGLEAAGTLLAAAGERRAAARARKWAAAAGRRDTAATSEQAVLASVLGFGLRAAAGAHLPAPAASGDRRPAAELLRATAEALGGNHRWLSTVASAVDLASPTVTWPGGVAGATTAGASALATARYWAAIRAALVGESGEGGVPLLALLPAWPPEWRGHNLEAHGLPSEWGRVSLALRWHGPRPALLWSVEGAPASLRLRAPALDPAWDAGTPDGEALLQAPPDRPSP